MGLGKALKKAVKSVGKAIEKPFKELGDGWWTDVRYPVVGAAAGALGGYFLAPLAAGASATAATATAGAVKGGLYGAIGGSLVGANHEQLKAQQEQLRIQQETAQQQLEASFAASLNADSAPAWEYEDMAQKQALNSRARKKAYSMSKTVNRPLALGSLAGRQTLG